MPDLDRDTVIRLARENCGGWDTQWSFTTESLLRFASLVAEHCGHSATEPVRQGEVELPKLPLPRPRRHRPSCAVFDPTPGSCDCGSLSKCYDADDMQGHATAALRAAGVKVKGEK